MITPKFEIDTSQLKSITKGNLKAQTKFALVGALNNLAFDARKKVQTRLPRWLQLTKRFLPSSVVVDKANKNNMTATVGFLKRANLIHFMEDGKGTRTPSVGSKVIAVPTKHVKRNSKGGITKANRPTRQLQKKNVFQDTINGNAGIFRRIKKKVVMLYGYEKSARYDKKFTQFQPTIELLARLKFPSIFKKSLAYALRTTKKR